MAPGFEDSVGPFDSAPDDNKRPNPVHILTKSPAIVLWWDHKNATVICPFCNELHGHYVRFFLLDADGKPLQTAQGDYTYVGGKPGRTIWRLAPCSQGTKNMLYYSLVFPFGTDERIYGLGWENEVYKDESGTPCIRFRTVGLDPNFLQQFLAKESHEEETEVQSVTSLFQHIHLESPFDEQILSPDDKNPNKRCVQPSGVVVEDEAGTGPELVLGCRFGCSPNSSHHVRDTRGCSFLGHLIAQGQYDKIYPMLYQEKSNVDSPDENGRTPLMEAALWGQVDTVVDLLDAKANPSLEDGKGMTAAGYAAETPRNDKERHQRHASYVENPHIKKAERAKIRGLLGVPISVSNQATYPLNNHETLFFYISPLWNTISFLMPKTGNHIRSQNKTAAILCRGNPFAPCLAISGWSGTGSEISTQEAGFERIDAAYWTDRTLTIARRIGHDFPIDGVDPPSTPGFYYACHAEAKLMSFLLDKCFIFQNDDAGQKVDDELVFLSRVQRNKPESRIYVSKPPCQSCRHFRNQIKVRTGICIELILAQKIDQVTE